MYYKPDVSRLDKQNNRGHTKRTQVVPNVATRTGGVILTIRTQTDVYFKMNDKAIETSVVSYNIGRYLSDPLPYTYSL